VSTLGAAERARPNCIGRYSLLAAGIVASVSVCLVAALPALGQAAGCSNANVRQGASVDLPTCRAYEQVSPVDKNGADITFGTPLTTYGPLPVQGSGDAVVFRSNGAFAGTPWGGGQSPVPYFARRGADGWQTVALVGRPQNNPAQITAYAAVRPNFTSVLLNAADALRPGDPPGGLYDRNTVTGVLTQLVAASESRLPLVWSQDSQHLTFSSVELLGTGSGPASGRKAYEMVGDTVRQVSRLPDETAVIGQVGSYGTIPDNRSLSNAVSDDGEHIFFTNPIGNTLGTSVSTRQSIYRRTAGANSDLATPSKRTDCAGDPTCGGDGVPTPAPDPLPGGKRYETATPDGNRVFFTSPELLTDDANTGTSRNNTAPRDLYRYDFDADELIDISAETNDADGAQVQGVVEASDDGDWVYYVALGQVVAGQGTLGQPNLYLWHDDGTVDGETRFIATLVPAAGDLRDSATWTWSDRKTARVTPDGRRLLFQSVAAIPGHDAGGVGQIYMYDALANAGAGALDCLSCNPLGEPPLGPSDFGQIVGTGVEDPTDYPRYLSDDGERAFFTSADRLVARDQNGKLDAYMWEGGDLYLLSTGRSTDDSIFYSASSNGDEAFILTREQLVGWDGDSAVDLYVAKVGGGLPEPVSPHNDDCVTLADGCQGGGAGVPLPAQRDTDRPRAGNPPATARVRVRVARVSAKARRRAAKRGVLTVRVRTSGAGVVKAAARARVKGKRRRVGAARKRVAAARSVTLRLRLSRAARRHLKAGKALKVTLRVTQPEAHARSRSVTLKNRKAGR
jgi:hypothetical protein